VMNFLDAKTGHTWTEGTQSEAQALEAERARMVVSRFQAKAALLLSGRLSDVESAIEQSGAMTRLAWAEAVELRRTSPMIAALSQAIGLSDADIDDLFRKAALIEA